MSNAASERSLGVGDALRESGSEDPAADFPSPAVDVFKGMDDGIDLAAAEIKGRNSWNLWCAGDERFWDEIATRSGGLFELLKTLDSRKRGRRLQEFGLINQPGFRQATKPDKFGLWLDAGAEPAGIDPKIFGRSSGVLGFRIFDNPDFTGEAVQRWQEKRDPTGEARAYYEDSEFGRQPGLVRPYRVGVTCGACHIAYNPCHPPTNPNEPEYRNLASAIGNQYLREGAVFAPNIRPGSFFYEMLARQPRGTSDTSRIATDHINNPSAINAIFLLGERLRIAHEEKLAGGALALTGATQPQVRVPRILKDGADSAGLRAAMLRVYVNIGLDHTYFLQRHDPLLGLQPQQPFDISVARRDSAYWRATERKLPDMIAFLSRLQPFRLADAEEGGAQVGRDFLLHDEEVIHRGKLAFAQNCARCHSSKRPPAGESDEGAWFAREIMKPGFEDGNFFSDEERYPVTEIKTNADRACATNAMDGHIWDNFSSQTYKELSAVGEIEVWNPYSGRDEAFAIPGGGPGYYRTPSLAGLWSSAPFFHNNSLGEESVDPSVAGRMKAFDDAAEKLLWPERRPGKDGIWRTARETTLRIPASVLPESVRAGLSRAHLIDAGGVFELGPIPAGTPVNLLANINPSADAGDWAALLVQIKEALGRVAGARLDEGAIRDLLKTQIAPALWKVSACPDLVPDRGPYFGTHLPDDEKRALIEYLKTL